MSATITVTATVQDPSGTALAGNSFVRFRLRNFTGFVPQVSGTSILPEIQVDATPTAGLISQALWPNNAITPSTTFYTVELWNNGRITSSGNYIFNVNTSLNSATQVNAPPVPSGFSLVLEHNGALNSSQSTLNLQSANGSVTITDLGSGNIDFLASTGLAVNGTPRTGDVLRYNMYGGSTWDTTSILTRKVLFTAEINQSGGGSISNMVGNGAFSAATGAGTISQINATATEGATLKFLSSASAGSGTGFFYSATGNGFERFVFGTVRRFAARAMLNQTANTRWFCGLASNISNYQPSASDTPNNAFVGFRYSNGTDASIVAVCQTDNAHVTATATGVSPDTSNSQLFEWAYDGTNVYFYIDGVLKATVTTNVPVNTQALNMLVEADNKNTANAIAFQLQLAGVVLR